MNPELILRITLGIIFFGFGIDQLKNWEPWGGYVPAWLKWTELPNEKIFWGFHAIFNILLGMALFSGLYLSIVSAVTSAWLLLITIVTSFTDWQIGLRDLGLTAAALALLLLSLG